MNSIAKYQMIQEACPLSALLSFTQQYAYSISLHTNCRSERNSMSILDVSSEVVTGYMNHFSASKFMFLISKLMFLISKLMFFISKLMRLSVKVGFIFIYFRMILSKATFTSKLSGTRLVVAIPRVSFNRERGDISRCNKLEVPASDKVRSGFVI